MPYPLKLSIYATLGRETARRNLTPTAKFFLKDLPPNFYVSVQFCVGFAAAALVASILYASIVQN